MVGGQQDEPHPAARMTRANDGAAPSLLAQGLTLEAWIDYAEPDGVSTGRRISIRAILGNHAADGCPMPTQLRAWCHRDARLRSFDVACISALRASPGGTEMRRTEDIAMWLRVESALLHARDVERLNGLRRRAQHEAEAAAPEAGAARRQVRPTPVRIETTRDDAPMARRIEDLYLLSWEAGPGGTPVVIFVAKDPDARRGRAVRIAPAGEAPNRLLMLQAPPGGARVLDVPHWVALLPARAG